MSEQFPAWAWLINATIISFLMVTVRLKAFAESKSWFDAITLVIWSMILMGVVTTWVLWRYNVVVSR